MITQRKTANAVGGTTTRACESCLRKRARWYCTADEAFLCQSCDASVHSANQLASRHERIRLENASFKSSTTGSTIDHCRPAWHQGFTRKARTPRHPKSKWLHTAPKHEEAEKIINSFPLVPEISGEDACLNDDDGEEEEQLLYRVPVFDPFAVEFSNVGNDTENVHTYERRETYVAENGQDEAGDIDDLHGFLPPDDMDLLESLLGTGTEDEPCGIEGLGFIDCKEEDDIGLCFDGNKVKVEGDDDEVEAILAYNMDPGLDITRETLDWNFDYESPVNGEDQLEEEQKVEVFAEAKIIESKEVVRNKIILNLNYEGVISSWANQGSPWTTGIRPEFNSDDCWPDFMDIGSAGMNRPYAGMEGSDGGRQARVLRYREKRRTRLFSKKIRYEVRKLNAEKRPRMKGRFVKRTSFAVGSAANFPLVHTINK